MEVLLLVEADRLMVKEKDCERLIVSLELTLADLVEVSDGETELESVGDLDSEAEIEVLRDTDLESVKELDRDEAIDALTSIDFVGEGTFVIEVAVTVRRDVMDLLVDSVEVSLGMRLLVSETVAVCDGERVGVLLSDTETVPDCEAVLDSVGDEVRVADLDSVFSRDHDGEVLLDFDGQRVMVVYDTDSWCVTESLTEADDVSDSVAVAEAEVVDEQVCEVVAVLDPERTGGLKEMECDGERDSVGTLVSERLVVSEHVLLPLNDNDADSEYVLDAEGSVENDGDIVGEFLVKVALRAG
jgi:hypothetical protein